MKLLHCIGRLNRKVRIASLLVLLLLSVLLEALVSLLIPSSSLLLLLSGQRVLVGELFQMLAGDVTVAGKLVLGLLEEI